MFTTLFSSTGVLLILITATLGLFSVPGLPMGCWCGPPHGRGPVRSRCPLLAQQHLPEVALGRQAEDEEVGGEEQAAAHEGK